MKEFAEFITIFFGDITIFAILQFLIFFVFVYAITGDRKKKVSNKNLKNLRMSDLILAYSLISASIIQSIGAVDMFVDFKLSITITNLVAAFYLSFFSPWFQGILAEISKKMGRGIVQTKAT